MLNENWHVCCCKSCSIRTSQKRMTPVSIKRRISFCMLKAENIQIRVSLINHINLPSELKPCWRKYCFK